MGNSHIPAQEFERRVAERAECAVLVKLRPAELAAIDRVRGGKPRTVWIKELCAASVIAHDALAGYRPGALGHEEVDVEVEHPEILNRAKEGWA